MNEKRTKQHKTGSCGLSATVPRTVCYSTLDYQLQYPRVVRSSKIRNRTPRKQFCSRSENHHYSTPRQSGLGAGLSVSKDTEQQRKHRKEPDSRIVCYITPRTVHESVRTERPKIASNQKSSDLRPNQNQVPPNFNHMVTRQYVSYP
jgi:hypothetical protein